MGSELLYAVEEWAVAKGYSSIRLRSNVVRAEAHFFYQTLGYTNTKTSCLFEKTL